MAETISRRGRHKTNKAEQITIVQWNQKDLTRTDTDLSGDRIEKVAKTINNMDNPSVIAMEEVVSGEGGERAVKEIVAKLKKDDWTYALSDVVNPNSPRKKERYAVIWRKSHMGEDVRHQCIMPNGFLPRDSDVNIGAGSIDLNVNINDINDINLEGYKKLKERFPEFRDTATPGFDRCPVVFSFDNVQRENGIGKKISLIVCHSSTDNRLYQNMVESMCLQSIAVKMAKDPNFGVVVLLGDLNIAEAGTERIWDVDKNLPDEAKDDDDDVDGIKESDIFGSIKREFMGVKPVAKKEDEESVAKGEEGKFMRAVSPKIPTNVFPFLASITAEPKHNDDIWVARHESLASIEFNEGSVNKQGNSNDGKVVPIPDYVLHAWDTKTTKYFLQLDADEKFSRSKLNNMLSRMWSDHRPVSVVLKPPKAPKPESKKGGTKRKATK